MNRDKNMRLLTQNMQLLTLVPIYSSIQFKVCIYKYTYIEKLLQCVRANYYAL